ncbi:DUF6242 domain-containing protein [uncultured Bacteroides sp.]|uniref:DUF6242 domain-containing protein n=1 Tax=uncultured Bacteroides sp. TaxID=162156 RepID=UPI002AAC003F|nr:DUF6242 domain-containing protein [uncultured Bacteroides sp.]
MKIKVLSITVISITLCLLTSCLGSDNPSIDYSTDDTIHAFALGTIHGVDYAFTIDQANNKIYNIDSLPFRSDTIVDKTLIKSLSSMGYITSADTLFNYATDSIDLSNTMNNPLKLKVTAPDGLHSREYSIEVRIHQQNPDALEWSKMSNSFSNDEAAPLKKAIILGSNLLAYTSNTIAYTTPISDGHTWGEINLIGLPESINWGSIQNFKNNLYISTTNGDVYVSENGVTWEKQTSLSGNNITTLLTTFPKTISAIINNNGEQRFCISNPTLTGWVLGDIVPDNFPSSNISSTIYTTDTGLNKAFLVGKELGSATKTTPWFSLDGKIWAEASTTSNYYYPLTKNPSITHFNKIFYSFGSDIDAIYTSKEGIVWKKIEKDMVLPSGFNERDFYSMTVDHNSYIWIIYTKEGTKSNEVWRGRINRLGFLIQ